MSIMMTRHVPFFRMVAALAAAGFPWSSSQAADVYTVRGLTEPVGDVILSVATPGIIAAIRHGEGTFVDEGTVIIELSSRAEELEMARRDVQLKTVTSELARSELLFKTSSSVTRE